MTDFKELAERARSAGVDLVVVGPDHPLAEGIVDVFTEARVLCFGPTAAAARIESSKAFAKEVMKAAGVPTARHFLATTLEEAQKVLKSVPWPGPRGNEDGGWVIKADGLALGKGVRVCSTFEEAQEAVAALMPVSGSLVIEEKLSGEEISWLAFCDGDRCALFESARDFKRLNNQDLGPNTGGMGSFSPVPGLPQGLALKVRERVFLPTLREMRKRGAPFQGILYAGLMFDRKSGNFNVLEFNARFGDPETQALLPRMSGDLYSWCEASARGDLSGMPTEVPFNSEFSVVVVGASQGYPEKPVKGLEVVGPIGDEGFFIAGVSREGDARKFVTSGGRVFAALGLGNTLTLAREAAYLKFAQVRFEGIQFRSDIGAEDQSHAG